MGYQMSPPFHMLHKVGLHESINHYIMLPHKVICRPYTTHVQKEVNLNNNLTKLGNGCNPFTLSFASFLYPCSFCWIHTIYCVSCGWAALIVQPSIPYVWTQRILWALEEWLDKRDSFEESAKWHWAELQVETEGKKVLQRTGKGSVMVRRWYCGKVKSD